MRETWRELVAWIVREGLKEKTGGKKFTDWGTGGNRVYPGSIHEAGGCILFLAKVAGKKTLVAMAFGESPLFSGLVAPEPLSVTGVQVKLAEMCHKNAALLRQWFPFMNPVAFGRNSFSLGLGDRLGLASPGHLRCLRTTKIRPVLAQQSIRELNLTQRTYEDVLDAASWAVFQEGFHEGFGADGDHLKKPEEVKMALDIGYSMITLDCSEKIDNTVDALTASEVSARYAKLDPELTLAMEKRYLGKTFMVGKWPITFTLEALQRTVLIYGATLAFIKEIYEKFIARHPQKVDFELSIDETATPTTLEAHYFMASEVKLAGIDLVSLAPRFCGEFQKAIDYIGDLAKFEAEFVVHSAIADHFGYRLSIHSGSDKFGVFPIIGKYTHGRVHVKTAGTNWLEALRVVCRKNPGLFREICAYSRERFPDATKFYHVTTNLAKVPDTATLPDDQLERMLDEPDPRQLLHITYGYILTDRGADGKLLFRDQLYELWNQYEDEYADVLVHHIGKHVQLLTGKV